MIRSQDPAARSNTKNFHFLIVIYFYIFGKFNFAAQHLHRIRHWFYEPKRIVLWSDQNQARGFFLFKRIQTVTVISETTKAIIPH